MNPTATDFDLALGMRPALADLQRKYEQSCMACHTSRGEAPLAGFRPHWEERLRLGMDGLVDRVRNGYKGMPSGGLCNECSESDIRQLIQFMSIKDE